MKHHTSTTLLFVYSAQSSPSSRSYHGALDCCHCLRRSAAQASQVPGLLWCRFWHRFSDRPTSRRRLHDARHLEIVLLPQPSPGRCGHGVDSLLAPSPRPSRHQYFFQKQAAAAQRPRPACPPSRGCVPVPGPTIGWHQRCREFWA